MFQTSFDNASFGGKRVNFDPNHGNIYLFGDSFNDPGQFHHVREGLSLDVLNVALKSQDGSRTETIRIRGQHGCASNGKVQADFVAKKLNMTSFCGFALKKMPAGHGNLVNFSLSGAAQSNNSVIYFSEDKPVPSFDVVYQVKKAQELVTALTERDVCIIQVTFNDIFLIYQAIIGQQGNWPKPYTPEDLEQNYVASAVANINSLYDMGCRRLILPIFSSIEALRTPNWKKVDTIVPGLLADLDGRLARMQQSLKREISQKVQEKWKDVTIELVDATMWWEEVQEKMDITSTLTDEGWTAGSTQENKKRLFFFDDTHPSQEAHKKLAKLLIRHL